MPIEYDIIEDKQLVLAKGSGVVTGKDVIKHLDGLASDNKYKAPMKKLVDYRTVDSIQISSKEAESIALQKKSLTTIFAGERCAFVSPGDLTYGTSRVHQSLVETAGLNTAVFRHLVDALEWLDVTLDMSLE